MRKIIAALDRFKYWLSTQQLAVEFARKSNVHLAGVFLEAFTYHIYKIHELTDRKRPPEDAIKTFTQKMFITNGSYRVLK